MNVGDEDAVAVNVLPHVVVRRVREDPARRRRVARASVGDVHAHTGVAIRTVRKNIRHGSSADVSLKQAVVLEELNIGCIRVTANRSGIGVLGKHVAREVRNSRIRLVRELRITHRLCGNGKREGEYRSDKRGNTLAHSHAAHTLL